MGFLSARKGRSPQSYEFVPTSPPSDGQDELQRDKPDNHASIEELQAGISIDEYQCSGQARSRLTWSQRLAGIFSLSSSNEEKIEDALPLLSPATKRSKRSYTSLCGIVLSFFPDEFDKAAGHWRHVPDDDVYTDVTHWPTDVSRDIIPVGCHSHNDYWRRVPLYAALQAGCIGVEADVWLIDNELYVGHTSTSLTAKRTLKNMYIDPLIKIIERQNPITQFHPALDQPLHGVFDTDPSQTLILLIDFKTDGEKTWQSVMENLSPLRERGYLTYFNGTGLTNGPITVVGTGNTPFNMVTSNSTYRDIFFDAPLNLLAEDEAMPPSADADGPQDSAATTEQPTGNAGQGLSGISAGDIGPDTFNWTNSFYASVSFKKSIGFPWGFHLTNKQMDLIRAQIQGAHRRGLKVRYWGLPSWPRSLRNHIWTVLAREGVDILNVDDLQSATKQEWKVKIFDW
ncbi:altered inheritance of mitochondria protein 6 [Aspergillus pseudoviridinutans]|uniref:Altered inheritance of mitochondria protein 6 n=1 Tax=Aspergillus pseudoviridinutans TaxID=1517512 RepID=A0A9P3BFP0_9EURO|nr:altered inheritance of mitochondria protein 6 [Aspergillus pseudoviridinutans]GIJ89269.1 altered inheritance of mitochondria protein 6 [Aspergillus pseudoviridinutans]